MNLIVKTNAEECSLGHLIYFNEKKSPYFDDIHSGNSILIFNQYERTDGWVTWRNKVINVLQLPSPLISKLWISSKKAVGQVKEDKSANQQENEVRSSVFRRDSWRADAAADVLGCLVVPVKDTHHVDCLLYTSDAADDEYNV